MSLVQILRELWFAEEMTGISYRVVIQKSYFAKKRIVFLLSFHYTGMRFFRNIPEFSRPQRSFSWKSQIRFNIYGGGGGEVPYILCAR